MKNEELIQKYRNEIKTLYSKKKIFLILFFVLLAVSILFLVLAFVLGRLDLNYIYPMSYMFSFSLVASFVMLILRNALFNKKIKNRELEIYRLKEENNLNEKK